MATQGSQLQVFTWLYGEFDAVLNNYIADKASDIIQAIAPTAYVMLGIYFLLWGFSMIRGLIQEPVMDGLFRMLKIALVLGFALNLGLYQSHIVEFFMKTPDAMASVIVLGDSAAAGDASTYGTIDTLLNKSVDVARKVSDKMSMMEPGKSVGLAIASFLILFAGLFFTIAAGVMIIMAKVAVVLLLALGPIFIMLAMFKTTQRFFEAWLGQVINYMLTIVLLLAVVSLFFGLTEEAINNAASTADQSPLEAVATVAVAFISAAVLLFQVPGVASGLANGVSLNLAGATKRAMGGGVASTATNMATRAALAKATGGASVAASAAGTMLRMKNNIRR